MKSCFKKLLFIGVAFVTSINLSFSQGIVAQHAGDADPTTEGFSLTLGSGGSVSPVLGDLGMNAWNTAVGLHGQNTYYSQNFASGQTAALVGNWELTIVLRVVQTDTYGNTYVQLETGPASFLLFFGAESNGDPFVRAGGQQYILTGTGSTYNTYQIVYNAATDTATFWINGAEYNNNMLYSTYSPTPKIEWGESQAGSSQANWNLVSLIVPEPSTWSLMLLGGVILFYICKRKQHA